MLITSEIGQIVLKTGLDVKKYYFKIFRAPSIFQNLMFNSSINIRLYHLIGRHVVYLFVLSTDICYFYE